MATNKTTAEKIVDSYHTGRSLPATIAAGTQVANITDASEAHALNATFSDVEVEAALDALGAKINAIIAALEAFEITASS